MLSLAAISVITTGHDSAEMVAQRKIFVAWQTSASTGTHFTCQLMQAACSGRGHLDRAIDTDALGTVGSVELESGGKFNLGGAVRAVLSQLMQINCAQFSSG